MRSNVSKRTPFTFPDFSSETFCTYQRTSETGRYVTLTRDVDLRTLEPDRDVAALIPSC